ncbi:11196_t:CDS:2 [Paraglomus brasilianum]|uniref:Uridylate kinase n=1 Tax=Paraglomus brasilianum TaxID=144538 RepID=A0A9N9DBS0_9GLOM|nr:11196_t:CDS:2 [Paraglomus brasilianum]
MFRTASARLTASLRPQITVRSYISKQTSHFPHKIPFRFITTTPIRYRPPTTDEASKATGAGQQRKPSFIAILAVASVGLSAYLVLVKSREGQKKAIEQKLESRTKPAFDKDKYTVVFVLGGPGSGKGTQCQNLVRDFGFVHLSAGDLLRAEQRRPGSEFGELINTYIKEGRIVPMEITIALLEKAMREDGGTRFLVDGFPRKMDQAVKFEETVCESKSVLYFECPEEVMLTRLLHRGETSGRVDDNIETIRKRFKTFVESSYPVVQYFEKKGKVKTVLCVDTPEKVYEKVKEIFKEIFKE